MHERGSGSKYKTSPAFRVHPRTESCYSYHKRRFNDASHNHPSHPCFGGDPNRPQRCTTSATPTPQPPNGAQLPNPASQNCEERGGQLTFAQDPNGGTYGVCVFPDGKQCEEWAMFRGECPVGGVDVTGYVTEAARFCAITGGA